MLHGLSLSRLLLAFGLLIVATALAPLSYADNSLVTDLLDPGPDEFYMIATGIISLLLIRRSKA